MAAVADEIDMSFQTRTVVPKRRRDIIFGQRLGRLLSRAQERTQETAASVASGTDVTEATAAAVQDEPATSPASPPQHTVGGCCVPDIRTLQTTTLNRRTTCRNRIRTMNECTSSVEPKPDQDVAKDEPPTDTVPCCMLQAVPSISMDLTGAGKFDGNHTSEAIMSCYGIPIDLTLETHDTNCFLVAPPPPPPCVTESALPGALMLSMDVSGARVIEADGSEAPPSQTVADKAALSSRAECILVCDCLDTVDGRAGKSDVSAEQPPCVTTMVFDDLSHLTPRASTMVFENISHFAPNVAS